MGIHSEHILEQQENISRNVVCELVCYNPEKGNFFWKSRKPKWFDDKNHSANRCCKVWNTRFAGTEAFRKNHISGYKYGSFFGKNFLSHRLAWLIIYGVWPNEIDHINGNRTDNRIINLRDVTRSENMRNLSLSKANSSGIVGISKVQRDGTWLAQIGINGKVIRLGNYKSFEEACSARRSAELKYKFHENHGKIITKEKVNE